MEVKNKILSCGCVSNVKVFNHETNSFQDGCVLHNEIALLDFEPELDGRFAKCRNCFRPPVESDFSLPFFRFVMGERFDTYYCGCFGFD